MWFQCLELPFIRTCDIINTRYSHSNWEHFFLPYTRARACDFFCVCSLIKLWGRGGGLPSFQKHRGLLMMPDAAHFQSFPRNSSRDPHKLMLGIRKEILIMIIIAISMKCSCYSLICEWHTARYS